MVRGFDGYIAGTGRPRNGLFIDFEGLVSSLSASFRWIDYPAVGDAWFDALGFW